MYLPSSNHNIELFKSYIEKLNEIVYMYSNKGKLVFQGDFNAHLQSQHLLKLNDFRSNYLIYFLCNNNFSAINTLPLCNGAKSTFVSYNGMHETMIDHTLCPVEMLDTVISCDILDDDCLNVSNHRPLNVVFKVPYFDQTCILNTKRKTIKWKLINNDNKINYENELMSQLEHLKYSDDSECINHNDLIDSMYDDVIKVINVASDKHFPQSKFKAFLKTYWTNSLKQLHKSMRQKRQIWNLVVLIMNRIRHIKTQKESFVNCIGYEGCFIINATRFVYL